MSRSSGLHALARRVARATAAALLAVALTATGLNGVAPASAADAGAISGRVTNTQGDPLPKSLVTLYVPYGNNVPMHIAYLDTDENGNFEFSGLSAGSYAVHVYGPRGAEYLGETWDNTGSRRRPTVITLAEGESRAGINLQLAVGGVVRGIVRDESGVPIPNVDVVLKRNHHNPPQHEGQTEWSTETDESGAYEIRRIDPGPYTARFSVFTGTYSVDLGYVTQYSDPIDVAGDVVVTGVDAQLKTASVISGIVTEPSGNPAGGDSVYLYELRPDGWRQIDYDNTSNEAPNSGRYVFGGLKAGTYTLEFSSNDYPTQWWGHQPDLKSADAIELGAGRALTADLRWEEGGRIGGTVTDETGVVVESSPVSLKQYSGGAWKTVLRYWTRADGTFDFDRMRSGIYTVEFAGAGPLLGEWWENAPSQESARTIELAPGASVTGIDGKLARATVPLSAPVVSGSVVVGSTLMAVAESQVSGATLDYEWVVDGAMISGATGPSFRLTSDQLGRPISVRVTAAAPGYVSVTRESMPTAAVAAGTLTTSTPAISGSASTGSTLTAKPGTWTSGTSFSYQWYASGVALSGATAPSLALTSAHAAKAITVQVTGTQPGYTSVVKTSTPTGKVFLAPHPSVSGKLAVGATLTAVRGSWTAGSKLSYEWYANGAAIGGTVSKPLRLTNSLAGKQITVRVTGRLSGYPTSSRTSTPTLRVISAGTPTISGKFVVGSTLTASSGTWATGTAFSYQWQVNGAAISGATSRTFVPTGFQAGKQLTVRVTGRLTGYATVSQWSVSTPKVARSG